MKQSARLQRRSLLNPPPPNPNALTTGSCGPQCILLIAGSAAGVLLATLLVLGILIYRRRRAQDDEDDMLAEMEEDWRFQPRTLSASTQGGRKFSTRSTRKQSIVPSSAGSGHAPWSVGGGGGGYGGASSYTSPQQHLPVILNGPVGRSAAPRISLNDPNALPRRPSRADLAQMEVYRKMSVIGIV